MKKLSIIYVLLIAFTLALTTGCNAKGTTYKYKNQDERLGLIIDKAVYLDDELKLYTKDLDGEYDLVAYDSKFKVINEDFSHSYRKGVFSIKGPDVSRISGLYLEGKYTRYHLRYLNSDEYALLWDTEATEIGWVTSGDTEKYYTRGELAEQKAKADRAKAIQEDNFKTIEGKWICERNPELYIEFYKNSDGDKKMEWMCERTDGEISCDGMYIAEVNINEKTDGFYIELLENPYYGRMQDFNMSKDKTKIIDVRYKMDNDIYVKAFIAR